MGALEMGTWGGRASVLPPVVVYGAAAHLFCRLLLCTLLTALFAVCRGGVGSVITSLLLPPLPLRVLLSPPPPTLGVLLLPPPYKLGVWSLDLVLGCSVQQGTLVFFCSAENTSVHCVLHGG